MSKPIRKYLYYCTLFILSSVILLSYLIFSSVYVTLKNQLILGSILVVLVFIIAKNRSLLGQFGRILLMVTCVFLTLRYIVFRVTITIYYDDTINYFATIMLFSAEIYGIVIYFLGMFVNVWPIKRSFPDFPEDESQLPSVDVYIPTFDEPLEIVETTAIASSYLIYPENKLNIYILDDGGTGQKINDVDISKSAKARKRSMALMKLAEDLNINYSTRNLNTDAKAGNINEALNSCECFFDEDTFDKISCMNHGIDKGCGEIVMIIDCDHVPARDFLTKTIGFFQKDPDIFLVQTPHFFINPNPVEKNLDIFQDGPGENEMFYGAVHPGLDFWNASFFCGSAALMRRKYLLEAGGFSGTTITEDAETSLELHSKGYKSVYINKPLIVGLAPEVFTDFIVQRSRWAQGMLQILILKNPLLMKGLSIFQKLSYLNATLFWFFGLARIIFFVSPLLLLYFGLRSYNASLEQLVAYVIPHLIGGYFLTDYLFGKYRRPFFSELFETIQSIYLLPAIISVLLKPKAPVFKVTPKEISRRNEFLSDLSTPFYIMTVIALIAYGFGFYKLITKPQIFDSIVICLIWNSFNTILLLACLGVVWEKRQIRKVHRYSTYEEVIIETGSATISGKIVDLSVAGVGLLIDKELIPEGIDNIDIKCKDSFGDNYIFPLKIQNRIEIKGSTKFGCSFTNADSFEDYKKIVRFVYGDSSRWHFFSEEEKTSSIGIFTGFFRLIKTGINGFTANLKGAFPIFISAFKNSVSIFLHKKKEI